MAHNIGRVRDAPDDRLSPAVSHNGALFCCQKEAITKHVANMNNRDLICSGHRVADKDMSAEDRAWAEASMTIEKDANGRWYHTLITDRDRHVRASCWNPDTGPWRKGVNY